MRNSFQTKQPVGQLFLRRIFYRLFDVLRCCRIRRTIRSLWIETERITIYAKTPELGEARETVSVQSCTATARFAIDARLLIDILAHIETESLAIEFTGEFAPVVIRPVGDERHICLVMPMRLES